MTGCTILTSNGSVFVPRGGVEVSDRGRVTVYSGTAMVTAGGDNQVVNVPPRYVFEPATGALYPFPSYFAQSYGN